MKEPGRSRSGVAERLVPTLGLVLLFWIVTMLLVAVASPFSGSSRHPELIVGLLTVPGSFAVTALLIRWERRRLADYGFELTAGTWLRFLCGLVLGFALIAAQTGLMMLAGGIRWVAAASLDPSMLLTPAGYLLLATREEIAFRGYPFRKLARTSPWAAQTIIAILFAIEHRLGGASWENALLGSAVGSLVFGMAALATRGLAVPIGLHAAWNMGDWLRGGKGPGGLWGIVVAPGRDGHASAVAMGSYLLVMASAFAGLWAWKRLHVRPIADTASADRTTSAG